MLINIKCSYSQQYLSYTMSAHETISPKLTHINDVDAFT
jgi:hypothetical protein